MTWRRDPRRSNPDFSADALGTGKEPKMAPEYPPRRTNATGDPRNRNIVSEPRNRGTADDPRYRSATNDPRRRGVVSEPLRRSAEDDPLARGVTSEPLRRGVTDEPLRRGVASDPRNLNAVDDELEELRRMSHDQDWLGRRPVPRPSETRRRDAPAPPSSRSFAPSSRSRSSLPWRCSFYDSPSNMRMAGLPSRPSSCRDVLVPDAAG